MKRWIALVAMALGWAGASTPVETHGWLSVNGNRVVDESGSAAKLRGMSLFWSQWSPQFWNAGVVDWLATDWRASIIRCPMAVDNGGYLTEPAVEVGRVETVVDAAIAAGLYVIIDWHEENAVNHQSEAVSFFSTMSAKYAGRPNVIYEVYNEPTTQTWTAVKAYATAVVAAIRANAPKSLIIVGTTSYSQDVDLPARWPVEGTNIAYTLHFYAATHGSSLRSVAESAMNGTYANKIALFVTEWGTCESSGSGAVSTSGSDEWLSWMDDNGISWANWSIETKNESCAALVGSASAAGGWSTSDLTTSGNYVRSALIARNDAYSNTKDTFSVPGSIPAWKSAAAVGTKSEADSTGGGYHLAYIDSGTSADYLVKATSAGTFSASVTAAGAKTGGSIVWSVDGTQVGTTAVSGTGGWQNWKSVSGPRFALNSGVHTLHLAFEGSGTGLFNLDTIALTSGSTGVLDGIDASLRPRIGRAGIEIPAGAPWREAVLADVSGRVVSRLSLSGNAAAISTADLRGIGFLRLQGSAGASTVSVVPMR